MALKKVLNYRGFMPEHWVIVSRTYDAFNDKTHIIAYCYKDKITKDANINNFIPTLEAKASFAGDLNMAQSYTELKKSDFFADATDD